MMPITYEDILQVQLNLLERALKAELRVRELEVKLAELEKKEPKHKGNAPAS